jgi:hypothetical protein
MTHLDFVKAFIASKKAAAKAKGLNWTGVHTVLSGFNGEFRTLFGNPTMGAEQLKMLPITAVQVLAEQGHVVTMPTRKGYMLYLKDDFKPKVEKPKETAEQIARKYGLTPPPVIAPAGQTVHPETGEMGIWS